MASYQDLLDAIARVRAATGQDDAWMAGLSPEDLTVVATPVSVIAPGAIDNVLNKIRAQHGSVFEPSAGEGAAAEAIRTAETSLAGQNSLSAQVDLQVVTAVLNAHTTHAAGRGALEDLQRDIESAVRTRTDLDTPAGARAFQRFLSDKLRDIRTVVETVGLDSTSKASLAAALASLYAAATPATADTDAEAVATEPRGESVESRPSATVPAAAPAGPPDQGPAPVPADDPLLDQLLAEAPGFAPADPPAAAPVPASPMMPATPAVPTIPSFGAGAGSPTGMPGGAGLLPSSSLGPEPAQPDPIGPLGGGDEPPDPALDPLSEPDEPETGEPETGEPEPDEPADEPESSVVALPGGDTVTAPSPQVAAAVTSVLAGTPVVEAYHRQGITIAAPGTPVTHPVEPARLLTGDLGMFTDHHVVALGNGKAVVNGSIEPIASVNGPSFLGWEHPPEPASTSSTPKSDRPTPTRPAVTAGPS